jgi:hypothetical protein
MKQTYVTMFQMAQTANAVMLYTALTFLAAAVLTLSIVVLKLYLRVRDVGNSGSEPHLNVKQRAEHDNSPLQQSEPKLHDQPFPDEDYPPPKDPLTHRLTYEPKGDLAKEHRIKAGHDRQNIRVALSSLAYKGAYVFDDIVTEAGPVDFLVITSAGIYKIYTMMHEGTVWRDRAQGIIIHSDRPPEINPETGKETLSGDPLPENPDIYSKEIDETYAREVDLKSTDRYWTMYCFTRARILKQGLKEAPMNVCPLMDMTRWITVHSEQQKPLPEGRVHELADITEEVYSRSPIVRPLEVESDC